MAKSGKAGRKEPAENEGKYERMMRKTKAKKAQDPLFPDVGSYECTFLGIVATEPEPGQLEWCNAAFEHKGEKYVQLHCMSGKSAGVSLPILKGLCMAITGTTDEAEYDEWDPKCKFLSALQGIENDYSEFAEECKGTARVRVNVARGSNTNDGDWYRNSTYAPGSDAGDDEDPESEAKPRKKGKRA